MVLSRAKKEFHALSSVSSFNFVWKFPARICWDGKLSVSENLKSKIIFVPKIDGVGNGTQFVKVM
jgi:hypothetical protein